MKLLRYAMLGVVSFRLHMESLLSSESELEWCFYASPLVVKLADSAGRLIQNLVEKIECILGATIWLRRKTWKNRISARSVCEAKILFVLLHTTTRWFNDERNWDNLKSTLWVGIFTSGADWVLWNIIVECYFLLQPLSLLLLYCRYHTDTCTLRCCTSEIISLASKRDLVWAKKSIHVNTSIHIPVIQSAHGANIIGGPMTHERGNIACWWAIVLIKFDEFDFVLLIQLGTVKG